MACAPRRLTISPGVFLLPASGRSLLSISVNRRAHFICIMIGYPYADRTPTPSNAARQVKNHSTGKLDTILWIFCSCHKMLRDFLYVASHMPPPTIPAAIFICIQPGDTRFVAIVAWLQAKTQIP